MSNAGGMATVTRYTDMLAGNTTWNPWEPDGAYDALATVTVPSGGVASINFAGIPNTYKHLQIRGIAQDNRATYNTSSLMMRFNGDTAANYSDHYLQASWTAGATTAQAGADVNNTGISWIAQITSTVATNVFGAFVIDVLDYADTTKFKTARSLSGADANAEVAGFRPVPRLTSGNWRNTGAINSITFIPEFGTTISQYSQFSLYGVK
jgi:hypothetical protein